MTAETFVRPYSLQGAPSARCGDVQLGGGLGFQLRLQGTFQDLRQGVGPGLSREMAPEKIDTGLPASRLCIRVGMVKAHGVGFVDPWIGKW